MFGLTLAVITVPAEFLGRLIAEVVLSLYFMITSGRFPLYDTIFSTRYGTIISLIIREAIILFVGLAVTAESALFLFRKRKNEIYFGLFWSFHFLIQCLLLIFLADTAILYPEYKFEILLATTLYTGGIYWLVYRWIEKGGLQS